ncbi:MAG: hypothetical protein LBP80_03935 [Treponema sp.]|nr:hypothetical protein [Treponema sp.]
MKRKMPFKAIGCCFALVFLLVLAGCFHPFQSMDELVSEESPNDETEAADTALTPRDYLALQNAGIPQDKHG